MSRAVSEVRFSRLVRASPSGPVSVDAQIRAKYIWVVFEREALSMMFAMLSCCGGAIQDCAPYMPISGFSSWRPSRFIRNKLPLVRAV